MTTVANITLREHLEARIIAIEKATILAQSVMEKRLEGMNEFRDSLKDQAARFVTRDELNAYMERINSDIRTLRESKATLDGKASQGSVALTLIISVSGLALGIVSFFLKL